MSIATRRASMTPSSPALSRRSSWVDPPAQSALSSRRGSRVDLTIQTSLANGASSSESFATASPDAKLAMNQLLTGLSNVSQSRDNVGMSSPTGSHSPTLGDSPGPKRKFEQDADPSTAYRVASANEIRLPTDPLRRASIINLATAAAAAVLQSQAGQRRMSTHPEQEQHKRQRVEQLGMLIEQARKASVTSMSHDMSRHVEAASQNVAIATVLANHLGLTPPSSATSTPSAGTPAPASPTKPHASSTLLVPHTPTTPRSPLSAAPLTAPQNADDQPASRAVAGSSAGPSMDPGQSSRRMPLVASPTSTPSITLNNGTQSVSATGSSKLLVEPLRPPSPPDSGHSLFEEAKEAAHTYSRFYRFEKEWAQKALELERRRSSVRIDPLFNPNPTLSPMTAETTGGKDRMAPTSPQQQSAPESRIMSRRGSPFGESPSMPSAKTSNSVSGGSFSSSHRGSSSGLANVLSNFAELIEHRQRSCSGLEALAKQAKELPVKRLSQPNPQFRTTFGDFSWAKAPRSATYPTTNSSSAAPAPFAATPLRATPQTIKEAEADSNAPQSGDRDEAAAASAASAASADAAATRPAHPRVQSTKGESAAKESEADAPATPRSSMSIASML
ncbi:hypothetical protein PHSY_006993 [Pseudozyma hubeiensis SY62]|uniref:Hgl1p, required for dimorphism and teliospore formation n=1 Tax=Pseudozyma hubeiensis (strain SY62) TaxID=1305764 RepID=R9PDT7_PSEHS|nr:hypothetical protein PHSY_006993 [Pseudozyma hubeiensis SY62]GAC99392.1 hypothetical protein PHSY_006993 [Pseudozyma hubeiensis SY62]